MVITRPVTRSGLRKGRFALDTIARTSALSTIKPMNTDVEYETIDEAIEDGADQIARTMVEAASNYLGDNQHELIYHALENDCPQTAATVAGWLDEQEAVEALAVKLYDPATMLDAARTLAKLDPPADALVLENVQKPVLAEENGLAKQLVRTWVEARAYDHESLSGDIERLLRRFSDEAVREGFKKHIHTNSDNSGTRELQINAIDRAVENNASEKRLKKLSSVLQPHERAVAHMADSGYDELARSEFAERKGVESKASNRLSGQARFFEHYGDERIPAHRPIKATRRFAILRRIVGTLNDIDPQAFHVVLDGPDQLRTIMDRADAKKESLLVRDLSRAIIEYEDEEAFDQYMPILLEHNYDAALRGALDFNTTEDHSTAYELQRAILLWGRDRNRLCARRVGHAVVEQQLSCDVTKNGDWTGDAQLIDMAYDFAAAPHRFANITTDSTARALTTEAAIVLFERADLSDYQHEHLLRHLVEDTNDACIEAVFRAGHTPRTLDVYQALINWALRERSEAFEPVLKQWSRDDQPVRGDDLFMKALDDIDRKVGYENQTALATVQLIRSGWRPSDEEATRAIYEELMDDMYLSPGDRESLVQSLLNARIMPPQDTLGQIENQNERLFTMIDEAMPKRQRVQSEFAD